MDVKKILKVIGQSAVIGERLAEPFLPGGGGLLGGVIKAVVFAATTAADQPSSNRKAIALGKLARENPDADLEKLSQAVDLQIAAMDAMHAAGAK